MLLPREHLYGISEARQPSSLSVGKHVQQLQSSAYKRHAAAATAIGSLPSTSSDDVPSARHGRHFWDANEEVHFGGDAHPVLPASAAAAQPAAAVARCSHKCLLYAHVCSADKFAQQFQRADGQQHRKLRDPVELAARSCNAQ